MKGVLIMNMNQFTQKSLAAIQGAQDIAREYAHPQLMFNLTLLFLFQFVLKITL